MYSYAIEERGGRVVLPSTHSDENLAEVTSWNDAEASLGLFLGRVAANTWMSNETTGCRRLCSIFSTSWESKCGGGRQGRLRWQPGRGASAQAEIVKSRPSLPSPR